MPSIPQSLLWISLVVLWLFVLVPMLISKRDAVRPTSDIALATRVLNSGARRLKRTGPAAGHRSDPHWTPQEEEWVDADDVDLDHQAGDGPGAAVMKAALSPGADEAEPDYLDVDVIDEDVDVGHPQDEPGEDLASEVTDGLDCQRADEADEYPYEYVEDTAGVEPHEDPELAPVAPAASRQRRFDTTTTAAVSARKYAFRKRVLMTMAVVLVGSATLAFEVTPSAWWLCVTAAVMAVCYLAYLRRQTRIEEKVRQRRMQRLARARCGVENTADRDYEVVPSRLRRPGAIVLEIDDEDPIFAHLDDAASYRAFSWPRDLPRAVGQ